MKIFNLILISKCKVTVKKFFLFFFKNKLQNEKIQKYLNKKIKKKKLTVKLFLNVKKNFFDLSFYNLINFFFLIFFFLITCIISNENNQSKMIELIENFCTFNKDKNRKRFMIRAKKFFFAYLNLPNLPNIFDLVRKCLNLKFQNTRNAKKFKYILRKEFRIDGGINLFCFLEFNKKKIINNPKELHLILKVPTKNSKRKKYVEYKGLYQSCSNKTACMKYMQTTFTFIKHDLVSNFSKETDLKKRKTSKTKINSPEYLTIDPIDLRNYLNFNRKLVQAEALEQPDFTEISQLKAQIKELSKVYGIEKKICIFPYDGLYDIERKVKRFLTYDFEIRKLI